MVEKIERLLVVATEALVEVRAYYAKLNGAELPLTGTIESAVLGVQSAKGSVPVAAPVAAPVKTRKTKAPPLPTAEQVRKETNPFANGAAEETTNGKVSIEDAVEAKRRCQEVMAAFIRRYLHAKPTGLDRLKAILPELCGRSISKLEELNYADHLRIIPHFERELDAADKTAV